MAIRPMRATVRFAFLLALIALGLSRASAQVTVSPSSLDFGSVAVNVLGYAPRVTLSNHYSSAVSLTSITFGMPQYTVNTGLPVQTIPARTSVEFGFIFLATEPGTYNSTITFNIKGIPGVVVQTTASAFTTTAVATLSTTSLSFGNVNFGSASTQSVTVTNTGGPDSLTIEEAAVYYQPFAVTGSTPPVTLEPGQSATYQVAFSPLISGSTTGSVTFCYDVLPCNAVDLTGSGTTPTQLSLTNYPALPYATQGFAYQANMTAVGGTPPYQFRVTSGSLPAGLSMAKTGAITGTVSSTAMVGTYSFTTEVQDSSQPKRLNSTENLTLTLDPPTGANCAVTSVNVPNTNTPIVDLMDLATGTYLGKVGGLYPAGSNTDPDPHHSNGLAIAREIQPIDGKYVMISIGESASQQPFNQFIEESNADPEKNPSLVIVDGAEGGATASVWTSKTSGYWTQLIDYSLPFAGVTANQVVAAWVSDVDSIQNATFPADAQQLENDFITIAQLLLQFFPNIKLMLFSSMNYTGYSQGILTTLPEPQAYESAFGAKWAITAQINGNPNLNYNPANGPVLAPWMGWAPYYWGNGLIPRSDNITWSCQDINSDGLHPADPWGHIKIAQYLLNWFKTADLTTPWFVQSTAK